MEMHSFHKCLIYGEISLQNCNEKLPVVSEFDIQGWIFILRT